MSKLSERVTRRGTDPEIAAFIDELVTLWNAGAYQARMLTSAPTHTGTNGEFYLVDLGGTQHFYGWVGGAWKSVALA